MTVLNALLDLYILNNDTLYMFPFANMSAVFGKRSKLTLCRVLKKLTALQTFNVSM